MESASMQQKRRKKYQEQLLSKYLTGKKLSITQKRKLFKKSWEEAKKKYPI